MYFIQFESDSNPNIVRVCCSGMRARPAHEVVPASNTGRSTDNRLCVFCWKPADSDDDVRDLHTRVLHSFTAVYPCNNN